MKLDRLLAKHRFQGRSAAHAHIAAGHVRVNGRPCTNNHAEISRFDEVLQNAQAVQPAHYALYLMLHKPIGYLSATADGAHPTVLSLVAHPLAHELHLAGRLDRSTSGLVLLTNDGRWSKALMHPESEVEKVYLVTTARPIPEDADYRFAKGIMLYPEHRLSRPARLERLSPRQARVTLHEGRRHQVKRMFFALGTPLTALHRQRIGPYELPASLQEGQWQAVEPSLIGFT
jgi:16S rRNA pseudouridine516 synthase